ncbi:MAG: hypothetical protein EA426_15115 [Spirochaetaceae bacterium]|nr:MAG: hypothetical protein EA426_15115 [Spirochaetaceae bacterium]
MDRDLPSARKIFRSSLSAIRLFFVPIVTWNLAIVAITTVILVPVFSSILSAGFLRGQVFVIGHTDLLSFVSRPDGVAYVILAIALALTASVMRFSGVHRIAMDARDGHRPTIFRTFFGVIRDAPVLGSLCVMVSVLGIVTLLPLFLGVWIIYQRTLGEFDINYYLSVRPPEWNTALLMVGGWVLIWAAVVIGPVGRTLLALPIAITERLPARKAFIESWRRSRPHGRRLAATVIITIVVVIVARLVVDAAFVWGARSIVRATVSVSDGLRVVAVISGALFLVSIIVDTIVSLLGFSFASLVLVNCYRLDPVLVRNAEKPTRVRPKTTSRLRTVRRWLRPGRVVVISLALVLFGFWAGSFLLASMPDPSGVAISAHRTGPPPAPENTLSALEAAIAAGADFTEIDVQLTADGVIVVVHDADLMRVARDPRRVAAARYEDLVDLVQIPDDGSPPSERRIARLGDVLERSRDRIGVMIELKYYGFDPRLAEAVADEISAYDMEDQVVVMSFYRAGLEQIRERLPDVPLGFLSTAAIGEIGRVPVEFIAAAHQSVNRAFVRSLRRHGRELHAWTVNDPQLMIDLIETGVDGLITDAPATAVRIRDELAELTPAERLLLRFGVGSIR